MPVAPRPDKAERGKGKNNRSKGSEKAWKRDEREDARWLQDNYGKDTDPVIKNLMTTTGRVGHFPQLGYDSTSEHAIGESKDRALPKWLVDLWTQAQQSQEGVEAEHILPQWLADAWAQINQCTATRPTKRVPVLFLSYGANTTPTFRMNEKTYKLPSMHVITREHHTELVKAWLALAAIQLAMAVPDETQAGRLYQIENILKEIE